MATLTRAEVEDLFERRRRAWLAGDADAYLALWADEMVIHLPGRSDPIRGKAAYAKVIEQSNMNMLPVSWEFHRLAIDGDHVLSEWTISGEVRQTHKTLTWRGMGICLIEDGLIHVWREYWDPSSLKR